MLEASWQCLAAYGRFVEIGKVDIGANSPLPMGGFAQNRSFTAVDLYHISINNKLLSRKLLETVMDLTAQGHIAGPSPLHVYSVAHVEQAFRFLQSGKNTGRIIVTLNNEDVVPVRPYAIQAHCYCYRSSLANPMANSWCRNLRRRVLLGDSNPKHLMLWSEVLVAAGELFCVGWPTKVPKTSSSHQGAVSPLRLPKTSLQNLKPRGFGSSQLAAMHPRLQNSQSCCKTVRNLCLQSRAASTPLWCFRYVILMSTGPI